ncbi:MAG: DUF3800 domain-containing protein [Sphingomicrobium sp.]
MANEDNFAAQLPLFADGGAAPVEISAIVEAGRYSSWTVYVDESGNYNTATYDKEFPVFVLAFCIFHKENYVANVVGALERFKFEYFGHDTVVLHEREIRKEQGNFQFPNKRFKQDFIGALHTIVDASNFIVISCSINKKKLFENGLEIGDNLYHVALGFCLESLFGLMEEKKQSDRVTHVIFESRGKREDRDLELEFRRICSGANEGRRRFPFEIVFADKRVNSTGLQIADLVARPIGLHVIKPGQTNRAFEVLTKKFYCRDGRAFVGENFEGFGLHIYP